MIAFARPWWLLLLLLWPLLLWLARRAAQASIRLVADFELWRRAAERLREPSPRSRPSLRDVAVLLPLVLLTLGVAEPVWRPTASPAPVTILVDAAWSMRTKSSGETRAARGTSLARRLASPAHVERVVVAAHDDLSALARAAIAAGLGAVVVSDRPVDGLPPIAGFAPATDAEANAGVTAAGFSPESGLLVRVDGDRDALPRTLSIAAGERIVRRMRLDDPRAVRVVVPPGEIDGDVVRVSLDPGDALEDDDVVVLKASRRPVRAALAAPHATIERALRACPFVAVTAGPDPEADLVVGAGGAASATRILVAPVAGHPDLSTGAPAPRAGSVVGRGAFEGLDGPARIAALHPLRAGAAAEPLLEIAGAPLLARSGRSFVFLADPAEDGWSELPAFPLTVARIAEQAAAAAALGFVADGPIPSEADVRVVRGDPGAPRPPAPSTVEGGARALEAGCHAAAALAILALILLSARRGAATTNTRPASARA